MIYRLSPQLVLLLWIAMVFAFLGHVSYLHPLLWIGLMVTGIWRIQVARGLWSIVNPFLEIALLVSILVIIFYQMGFNKESVINLLCTSLIFKFLEIKTKKDSILVVLISLLITVVSLSETKDIENIVYILFLIYQLFLWFSLNRVQTLKPYRRSVLRFSVLLLLALPITLVIFSWVDQGIESITGLYGASSGLSSVVKPGDISDIRRNYKPVFTAKFKDRAPRIETLYWRYRTLDHFDGKSFSATEARLIQEPEKEKREMQYTITFHEPGSEIYVLETFAGSDAPFLFQRLDGSFLYPHDRDSELTLFANPNHFLIGHEGSKNETVFTDLKSTENKKALEWAKNERKNSRSSMDFVERVMNYFHNEHFYYTIKNAGLKPPIFDYFMFESRYGFCEHYAALMVFLLRSVEIPSRMVVGFLGGERLNDHEIKVRLADAHAWVEVLDRGKWYRYDPTAAIHPDRVLSSRLAEEKSLLLTLSLRNQLFVLMTLIMITFLSRILWRFRYRHFFSVREISVLGEKKGRSETWSQFSKRLGVLFPKYRGAIEEIFLEINHQFYSEHKQKSLDYKWLRSKLKSLDRLVKKSM